MVGYRPNRQSIRLRGYDYTTAGAYFVTICTSARLPLLGDVVDGEVVLSTVGEVVASRWLDLVSHPPYPDLDAFVVMPNHVHGILWLPIPTADDDVVGATPGSPASGPPAPGSPALMGTTRATRGSPLRRGSLGAVVGGFKAAVGREVNERNLTLVRPIWQRNYHESIIRTERQLDLTRRSIAHNPACWPDDPEHPRFADPPPS